MLKAIFDTPSTHKFRANNGFNLTAVMILFAFSIITA